MSSLLSAGEVSLKCWLLVLDAPAQDMDFLGYIQEKVTKTAKGLQHLTRGKDKRVGTL